MTDDVRHLRTMSIVWLVAAAVAAALGHDVTGAVFVSCSVANDVGLRIIRAERR